MHWWRGEARVDPEGYPCRIGAFWARLFLRRGWALVARGTVWFKDERTFAAYLRDPFWRAHEHHHLWQERHMFANTLTYLLAFVWQYIRYGGRDRAPLEIEADEAARMALTTQDASTAAPEDERA